MSTTKKETFLGENKGKFKHEKSPKPALLKGLDDGADNRNRTCTELPRLEPESSASASSAISAY